MRAKKAEVYGLWQVYKREIKGKLVAQRRDMVSDTLALLIYQLSPTGKKNRKSLVSGGGSGGGSSGGGGGSKGGGGGSGGGDNGGGAGQSPYPLQAFCNSSISLRLETHFSRN